MTWWQGTWGKKKKHTKKQKTRSWADRTRTQHPAAAVGEDPTSLLEGKQPPQTDPFSVRKQTSKVHVFFFLCPCIMFQKLHSEVEITDWASGTLWYFIKYIDSEWQDSTSVKTIYLIEMSSNVKTSWCKKTGNAALWLQLDAEMRRKVKRKQQWWVR